MKEKHSEPWDHGFCNQEAVVIVTDTGTDTHATVAAPAIAGKRYTWRTCHRVMSPSPPTSRWLAGSRDLIKNWFPDHWLRRIQHLSATNNCRGVRGQPQLLLRSSAMLPIHYSSCTHLTGLRSQGLYTQHRKFAQKITFRAGIQSSLEVVQKHTSRKECGRCNPFSN